MGLLQCSSMDRRFFHRLGASLLDRTICASAGKAGWAAVIGASVGMDVEQYDDSKLIVIWGSNPVTSNLHFWTRAQEAKRRGAQADRDRSRIAAPPPRSATSTSRCCRAPTARSRSGIMHVLIAEDLIDRDYVDRYTVGFDALAAARARVAARARRATCGITREQVVRLARDYGTIKPAAIRVNYGMQRVHGGGNAVRAIACLPALVGAWRDPAGGALLSSSGTYPVDPDALERPDLIRGAPRTINMSAIGDALLDARRSAGARDLRLQLQSGRRRARFVEVVAGFRARRPLLSSCTRSSRPTPPTTPTSCCPRRRSSSRPTSTSRTATCTRSPTIPAIAPLGEALPNTEVFRRLAARMGFAEPCFRDSDDDARARRRSARSDVRARRASTGIR